MIHGACREEEGGGRREMEADGKERVGGQQAKDSGGSWGNGQLIMRRGGATGQLIMRRGGATVKGSGQLRPCDGE